MMVMRFPYIWDAHLLPLQLPAAPVLFLIDGADHYNILDANHESWLQLFKKIENLIEI